MLFNSYPFLLGFLPASLIGMAILGRSANARIALILAVSLFFYAWWDWRLLPLLIGSVTVNFLLGGCIQRAMTRGDQNTANRALTIGVAINLLVLGAFKYLQFFVINVDALTGANWNVVHLVLPLGISFWTFEQISFLVDLRRGAQYRLHPFRYALFVLFFPRLVAGPILRFSEIEPQIKDREPGTMLPDLGVGLSIFAIGLAKKSWLADGIAPYVAAGFATAAAGHGPDLFVAWGSALAYTCQLYFDFSGYSDMAIGGARCFGIRFPANFNSPYRATDIIEFWRRWHMTLSRFLRDYLYIPLGGNRRGPVRRYANLLITMLLGGLWHGAAWTFVIWGGLHGLYLMVNHAWSNLRRPSDSALGRLLAWAVTFLAVVIGWVFFRAPGVVAAWHMLEGMVGLNGAAIPSALLDHTGPLGSGLRRLGVTSTTVEGGSVFTWMWTSIVGLLAIAWFAPNTQQIMARAQPTLEAVSAAPRLLRWSPVPGWGLAIGMVAAIGLLSVTRGGEFLYLAILSMSGAFRYLAWCAAGLLGSLALCAGFAVLVDPYYVFGVPAVAGFNARHPFANDQMIAARSHLAERMRPTTLLLGNSRTEAGFDPASRHWPQSMTPVFDAGLPGMRLDAARRVMEAALAGGRLKHVMIAVEFLDTMGDFGHAPLVPPIRMPVPTLTRWQEQAHDWFIASLTISALVDSVRTVLSQDSTAINTTRLNGSADLNEYADYVRQAGAAALFDHKMAEYRPRFATYTPPDLRNPEANVTFRALVALLDAAHAAGCSVDIIIYPYHATVLDLLHADGLWPAFEDFKRALVQVVWEHYPGTRIVDFSGYNAYTKEARPPAGSKQVMHWSWEPGHFRTSLGDQIIERLYGGATDFGRDLRPDTIETALAAIRRERDEAQGEQRAAR